MLPECQLLGTLGCHLCEYAEAVLMPFVENGLLVELVDIADQPGLLERYALVIPCCGAPTPAANCTGRSTRRRLPRFWVDRLPLEQ